MKKIKNHVGREILISWKMGTEPIEGKLDKNIKGQCSRPNRTKKMGGNNQMKKLQNVYLF